MPLTPHDIEVLKNVFAQHESPLTEWTKLVLPSLIAFSTSLVILFVGVGMNRRSDDRKRRLDMIEKQLREFYGPVWGIYSEIKDIGAYNVTIKEKHEELRKETAVQYASVPEDVKPYGIERIARAYTSERKNDEELFKNRLLPLYRSLRDVFRDKMWLSDRELTKFWPVLAQFVDTWDRYITTSGDPVVFDKIKIMVALPEPFESLLQGRISDLRRKLECGDPDVGERLVSI